MGKRNRNSKLVPGCEAALDQMKYEIAAELGLSVGSSAAGVIGADAEFAAELGSVSNGGGMSPDYWGHISSRDAGAVGGRITQRLIRQAEQAVSAFELP